MEFPFFRLIREGTKAVPAVKFAVGIAAISAIVALIVSFKFDLRITLWGTFIILVLMFFLLLFARLAKTAQSEFKHVSRVLMWAFVVLFIGISTMLTTSVFFKWPINLQFIISNEPTTVTVDVEKHEAIHERVFRHSLSPNYMRLFGAEAVPLFMHVFENQDSLVLMREAGQYKNTTYYPGDYHTKGKNDYMSAALIKFWKTKWEYKDALPLKTDLWTKFSGKHSLGRDIFYTALQPTYKEYVPLTDVYVWDTQYDEEESDSLSRIFGPVYDEPLDDYEIGFLFVILTNTENTEIHDLVLHYNVFKNPLKLQKFPEYLTFKKFLTKPKPNQIGLSNNSINLINPEVKTLNIASLKGGNSIIWLLDIYRKKKSGLPDFYLTDVIRPIKYEFSIDGVNYYDTLRMPYGEKAARITIPHGWYSQ